MMILYEVSRLKKERQKEVSCTVLYVGPCPAGPQASSLQLHRQHLSRSRDWLITLLPTYQTHLFTSLDSLAATLGPIQAISNTKRTCRSRKEWLDRPDGVTLFLWRCCRCNQRISGMHLPKRQTEPKRRPTTLFFSSLSPCG